MDLEGFARRAMKRKEPAGKTLDELAWLIQKTKKADARKAKRIAEAVMEEVRASLKKPRSKMVAGILKPLESGVSMGEAGVGSRGTGDFFVHQCIGQIAGGKGLLSPKHQDDAGAVSKAGRVILVSVDGTHSRLSSFPFIAGFHVARAALRDVLVKGGEPAALFADLHLADDGDVARLFDFMAGARVVGELAGVPIAAGSTLRVGGDMVIGDRMVSCVGAVGVANQQPGRLFARKNIRKGDFIVMTHGAGGGTICTAAIYSGNADAVQETLNVDFIRAAQALLKAKRVRINAMLDVTNGGLRGDAFETGKAAGVGMVFNKGNVRQMVNPKVLALLESQGIDFLGVSLDSLLVFTPEPEKVIAVLKRAGVDAAVVGRTGGRGIWLEHNGKRAAFAPRFRESAYTKIKKLAGEKPAGSEREMQMRISKAMAKALAKMNGLRRLLEGKNG